MGILPFGCRAFSVKPRVAYSKTNLDPRSYVGINLGRCPSSPGAYRTWVPNEGKLVVSSEIYFDEAHFPWRSDSDPGRLSVPQPAPHDDRIQRPGIPAAGFPAESTESHDTSTIASAWAAATRRGALTARDSKLVLLLFSGPYHRPDGLAAFIRQQGLEVSMLDNDASRGDAADDITNDRVFEDLLLRVRNGHYPRHLRSAAL
jgi:hypothetical protein